MPRCIENNHISGKKLSFGPEDLLEENIWTF